MVASHLDRIVYLNGKFIAGRDANISIFDRGLLFADAVYEGLGVEGGKVVDFDMHMKRLERSLGELNFPPTLDRQQIDEIFQTLIEQNKMESGFLYLHITRGEADRDYVYGPDLEPNVLAFVQPMDNGPGAIHQHGCSMRSHPDLRWKRRDIKTSNLLGQVMAKNFAHNDGSYEALLIDDEGLVTEGGATSFFIIKDGVIFARPVTNEILHGVTRQAMLSVAKVEGLEICIEKYALRDVYAADEAFLTGASTGIQPVVQIDDQTIGDGKPGPITRALQHAYRIAINDNS